MSPSLLTNPSLPMRLIPKIVTWLRSPWNPQSRSGTLLSEAQGAAFVKRVAGPAAGDLATHRELG